MILHISTRGNDDTFCGEEKCRVAPRGWLDGALYEDPLAEGDRFVSGHEGWEWCNSCRDAVKASEGPTNE